MTERDYAIKSFKEITLNAKRHTEQRMDLYYEKIKTLMSDYQDLILENQMVLEELEQECQEKINENMAYALQYMDAYDYRMHIGHLKKEMNNVILIYGLCDMVHRAMTLVKYFTPNFGEEYYDVLYECYCRSRKAADVDIMIELGMSRATFLQKEEGSTEISSEKSRELYQYLKIHFSEEFATAIKKYLSTDFTAERMLRYIRNTGKCSMEMIVDEMLAILNDRDAYVQKQIEKNRRIDLDDLFIRGFDIRWNEELQDSYVYQIPAIANIDHFEFKSNITLFVGENGSGKSTLLEAFAVACGLNPEGGTANYRFSTYDDYSDLASAIRIRKGVSKPKWSYFLRAESFYNVASALMTKYNDDGKMQDLHARSHGESFLDFIQRADQPGLYIMDEPEAALSPQRQLTLLIHLVKMAQKGAQFVIVTHSPILLAIPDADIFSFDEGSIQQIRYEETESYQITKMFLDNREYMLKKLLAEDDEE